MHLLQRSDLLALPIEILQKLTYVSLMLSSHIDSVQHITTAAERGVHELRELS